MFKFSISKDKTYVILTSEEDIDLNVKIPSLLICRVAEIIQTPNQGCSSSWSPPDRPSGS